MKSPTPYHRNRTFIDGIWMDIDDLFDDGDDFDYYGDTAVSDDDFEVS